MIPKTIHYFWAGSDTMPENLRKYITSWQKFCPDYELRLWTPESFADNCPRWIRQAIDAKNMLLPQTMPAHTPSIISEESTSTPTWK